jgi:hypothetical protein
LSQETKTVQTQTGYFFSFETSKEIRIPGADPKYADKATITAKLASNEPTFQQATLSLQQAKTQVEKVLSNNATQNTLTTEYHQKCFQKKQQHPTEKIHALDEAINKTTDLLVRETLKLERRDLIEDSKSAAASSTEV